MTYSWDWLDKGGTSLKLIAQAFKDMLASFLDSGTTWRRGDVSTSFINSLWFRNRQKTGS